MTGCPRCGEQNAEKARFCWSCGAPLAKPRTAEVRKTVTILFVDVVGSTALGERTDPEALRQLMARYFDAIQTIVERHGGTLEKYIGDAVMAVFGVPSLHEDDALRGVRAAAEIRNRLAEIGADVAARGSSPLEWRTGVNTGEVVAGDASSGQAFVTGDAVNVAARLEQAAGAGEILLGHPTYALVRDAVQVEPAAALELKGKADAVAAYRLTAVANKNDRTPRLEAPMVGRRRQRRLLAEAYEDAVEERACHLLTILGTAGVGKSRLVREFLSGVEEARVLRGRCLSYGEGITYWPIAEIVRQAAGMNASPDDKAWRRRLGELIDDERARSAVVERLGELMGLFEGSGAREENFWAVRTLFESLARHQPLVVVIDDLQWAEPTLLDLVEHLAEWISDAPVMLICLARRELLDTRPQWAGGKPRATTVTLEPLNVDESRELVVSLLGQDELGKRLAARIGSAAEGNPLFVEEMLGMLIDGGQLATRNGGWALVGDIGVVTVPPSIQALLAARIDGLAENERLVLEHAAVEGQEFHRAALSELLPDEVRPELPALLAALTRKRFVHTDAVHASFESGEVFRFRHVLIREAAYDALPKTLRADLHAHFAEWLRGRGTDRVQEFEELLGYHYERAYRYRVELDLVDARTQELGRLAARHLLAAGQRAFDRSDAVAAHKLLTAANEMVAEDDPIGIRALAELALTNRFSNDIEGAINAGQQALELSRAAGEEAAAAYAELTLGQMEITVGRSTMAALVQRSQQLLDILHRHGDERAARRATTVVAIGLYSAGQTQHAEELLTKQAWWQASQFGPTALEVGWLSYFLVFGPTPVAEATERLLWILEAVSDPATERAIKRPLSYLRAFVGDFDEGRALVRRCEAVAREMGQWGPSDVAAYSWTTGKIELLAGNLAEALRLGQSALDLAMQVGDKAFASTAAGFVGDVHLRLANFSEAERFATRAGELAIADDVDAQVRSLRTQARVVAQRGEFESALDLAAAAEAMVESTDWPDLRGETWADIAEVYLAAGNRDEAISYLERARDEFATKGITVEVARVERRLAEIPALSGGHSR